MLSIIIIITSIPIMVEAEASEYDATYDISSASVSISTVGNYYVTGTSTSNTISISGNDEINITIDSLSITSSSTAPINITNTGKTTITLVGTNSLTSSSSYAALQTACVEGSELVINGEGTLTAKNSSTGAGIGTKGALTAV